MKRDTSGGGFLLIILAIIFLMSSCGKDDKPKTSEPPKSNYKSVYWYGGHAKDTRAERGYEIRNGKKVPYTTNNR